MIEVGMEAPVFSTIDDAGEPFSLVDARGGPVVLHFFVAAWSDV